MLINPTDYVDAGSIESCTEHGNCGIKMQVALGRTLTAADKAALNNCMDDLYAALMRETIRLSPKAKENAELQRTELLSCFSEPIYVEERLSSWRANSEQALEILLEAGVLICPMRDFEAD